MEMIDLSKGEANYLKYRFKQYLGSVSREIQNRRLKEQKMGMTRDEALKVWLPVIQMGVETMPECKEALDMAINDMRKYQKVEDIYYHQSGKALENSLRAVIEDGNI